MSKKPAPKSRPGAEPLRVKIEGDWMAAIGKAVKKPAPPGGWPKPESMPQRARKNPPKKKA